MKQHSTAILPTPSELVRDLSRFVIGQQDAKRDLATAIYDHYMGCAARAISPDSTPALARQNVLMMGPSGCGKTLLIKSLADSLGVPVAFGVATRFSETGYVGDGVESLISTLLMRAGGDVERARRGIIYIDEIDKIARKETRGRDISGEGVQHGLLSLIEGSIVQANSNGEDIEIDTSELLFIVTGAFSGLPDIVRQRLATRAGSQLGFATSGRDPITLDDMELYKLVETEDLVRFGLIPEFIGRFSTVTQVAELGDDDLKRILADSEVSPLRQQAAFFELHGISLQLTDRALRLIVEEARALGTGARGLARTLLRHLSDLRFRLPELQRDGVSRVVINAPAIRANKPPQLLYGERSSAMAATAQTLRRQAFQPVAAQQSHPEHVGRGASARRRTDTSSWSDQELSFVLEDTRQQLGLGELDDDGAAWWRQIELDYADRRRDLLAILEQLLQRHGSLPELHSACGTSGTGDLEANLHYMEFLRIQNATGESPEDPADK